MIDPKMPIVPVCGPVAIVSWGALDRLYVQASDLPPEIAQLLPGRRQRSWWHLPDVFAAISRFMRRFRPIHLSRACAIFPLRRRRPRLRVLQETLGRFKTSRLMACDVVKLRLMPEVDIANDIEALVSLGLMSSSAALKHIERQAKIWAKVADSLRAKVVMARLGRQPKPKDDSDAEDDPCHCTVVGPQMLVRGRGPRIGLKDYAPPCGAESYAEHGVGQVPEAVTRFVDIPFYYTWIQSYIRLGCLTVVGYTEWCTAVFGSLTRPVTFDHFCYGEIDALLVPIGCASVPEAVCCAEKCHPFDRDGWERLAELARVWREASQATKDQIKPVGQHALSETEDSYDQRENEDGRR